MTTGNNANTSKNRRGLKLKAIYAILGKGNVADQIVEAAKNVPQTDAVKIIVQYWENELRRLRSVCGQAGAKLGAPTSEVQGQLLAKALADDVDITDKGAGTASLFLWIVGLKADIEVPEKTRCSGYEELRKQLPLYKNILSPFSLETQLQWAAEDNYFANVNTTAVEDWDAFEALRGNPQFSIGCGIQTGLTSFDRRTGGLAGITLVAGPTGSGKTSLAIQLVCGVLESNPDACALFIELEDPKSMIFSKLLSHASGLPYDRLTESDSFSELEQETLADAQKWLKESILPRLNVVDRLQLPSPGQMQVICSPDENMRKRVSALLKATGCKRCLVVLDSLHRIVPITTRADENAEYGVAVEPKEDATDEDRMRELIALQKWSRNGDLPEGFPILAICRIRKDARSDKPLLIDDVLGSTSLTYDVRTVALLQRWGTAKSEGITPVRLAIEKVKDGGDCGEILLDFHHHITHMVEHSTSIGAKSPKLQTSSQAPAKSGRVDERRG